MPEPRAEKRYVHTRQGQLHCRSWTPSTQARAPLLCLHAMPYSGLHFATLAPLLADRRQVICPDYPGYGGSDALPGAPTIPIYAGAVLDMIAALELSGPVNVLGFHTGCLVAAEMALQSPTMIGRLVLIDVPFFEPEIRAQRLSAVATPPGYDADPGSMAAAWEMNVSSKLDKLPIDRCMELLAEQLRTGTRAHEGFGAAFAYPADERLASLRHDTLVIATHSSLNGPSHAAADCLPNARLENRTDLGPPVLDDGAPELAHLACRFLDRNAGQTDD